MWMRRNQSKRFHAAQTAKTADLPAVAPRQRAVPEGPFACLTPSAHPRQTGPAPAANPGRPVLWSN